MSDPTRESENKLALVLGSGGARGWAHFAVLELLDELGIKPDIITGTSIGSLIGAAVAANRLDTLKSLIHSMDWWASTRLLLEAGTPRGGIIDGKRIKRMLADVYGDLRIEDLPIPFTCVATDIDTGKPYVWRKGPLVDAVRASISIPGVFAPHRVREQYLVDGGLVDPLPVGLARELGAARTIAVDINLKAKPTEPVRTCRKRNHRHTQFLDDNVLRPIREWFSEFTHHNVFDIMTRTVRICENQITDRCLADTPPDVLIQPEVGHINALEFHRGEEAMEAGRIAAEAKAEELRKLVSR